MRTLYQTIYYPSRSNLFRLYPLADLHVGARACREDLIKRDVEAIANDPHALALLLGDYVDGICRKGDKRHDEATLAPWLHGERAIMSKQRDRFLELIDPIADKVIGAIRGNHERAAEKFYERDLYWEIVQGIADKAGREPEDLALGVQGFVVLRFRRGTMQSYGGVRQIVIYSHHGYGGGRLPGGHALALGRVLGDYECDIALLGHRHCKMVVPKVITGPGRGKYGCKQRTRWGAFCGSYLAASVTPGTDKQPIDTYAEEKGLPPQELGTVPIIIKPDIPRFEFRLASGGQLLTLEDELAAHTPALAMAA